tara:strand:+ start:8616 stop:9983 length:1368 start_codon:yes stop_codon:yes gene_type:complete
MKAIGYFYEDTESPEFVLSNQRESFISYCAQHDHQAVTEFVDRKIDDTNRSGYNLLLKYLQESGSEFLLLVSGTEILSNDLESSIDRILELDSFGAKVICTTGDVPDPFQYALKRWTNVNPKGTRGQQIKEAMMAKAMRGEGLGKPPFGYKIGSDGRLELNENEHGAVKHIFQMYTKENMGMRRIVSKLNQMGVTTRSGRGWSIVTIRDILRNRSYIGTYNRFGIVTPRNHTPIIEPETFRMAQEILGRFSTPRTQLSNEPFMLSGVIYCAYCNNNMIGVNRQQGWRRKDSSRVTGTYRYYQCQSRVNKGMCNYHTWRSDVLEETIKDQIKELLIKGEVNIKVMATGLSSLPDSNIQTEHPDPAFIKTLESVAAGFISLSYMRDAVSSIKKTRENTGHTSSEHNLLANAINSGNLSNVINSWHTLDSNTLISLFKGLIEKVTVSDDSIDIKLKHF